MHQNFTLEQLLILKKKPVFYKIPQKLLRRVESGGRGEERGRERSLISTYERL